MKRLALAVSIPTIVVLVAGINLYWIDVAFGDGPPYYSRTTNMDKWADPRWVLIPLDIVAAIVVSYLVHIAGRLTLQARRGPPPPTKNP